MKTAEEYRNLINEELEIIGWHNPESPMYQAADYALHGGGKRLRPVLALAMGDALNADEHASRIAALSVEIFHNFTLVHDDIMDKSDTRHGRPSVWAKFGEPTAILAGDVLAAMPINLLAFSLDPELARQMLDEYQGITMRVLEGQQQDMSLEKSATASVDQYIEMITNKTGALFYLACSLPAVAAGRARQSVRAAGSYGRQLGIAFQIMDDYLDTFGDPADFGKPIGGDILNDKNTILRQVALELAPERMIGAQCLKGEQKIAAVKEIYESLGLKDMCRQQIQAFTESAIDALKPLRLRKEKKEFFINFAHSLTERSR